MEMSIPLPSEVASVKVFASASAVKVKAVTELSVFEV